MALFRNGSLALFFAIVIGSCLLKDCAGETLVLDFNTTYATEWVNFDCAYEDDYYKFWEYACPADLGEDDIYPTKVGFWTPCRLQICHLVFFANQATQAKSITFDYYSRGETPQISVTSKYSPLDPEFSNEIGVISADNATGWHTNTLDLSDQTRALVLNFTLYSVGPDLLLLNKITLDFGEANLPTNPPEATTSNPVQSVGISLDTENDEWLVWNGDCMYEDDFYYNSAFGCPVNTENAPDGSSGEGFWTPCSTKTCRLQFSANIATISKVPLFMSVESYLEGDAKIVVSKANGDLIAEITESGWVATSEIPLDFEDSLTQFTIYIDLDKGENGAVLLDRARLNFEAVDAGAATLFRTMPFVLIQVVAFFSYFALF